MNLVEADSREFLMNRFHRRVEAYRIHHEQNYRVYQPIRREEVRRQLEETNQLHKRWIEFQAKRTVGKVKNETLASSAPSFSKKPKKKLPVSPEAPNALSSAYSQSSNVFSKPLSNVQNSQPSMCQNFKNQNVYQGFDQTSTNIKKTFESITEGTDYLPLHSEGVNMFTEPCSKSLDHKSFPINSSVNEHFQETRIPEENSERVDDEREMDNIFMGEDWDKFWDSISREGDMPKEVLQVLQENETCEDITLTSASFTQNFLQDEVAMSATNNETSTVAGVSMTTSSFVPCDVKSIYPSSTMYDMQHHVGTFSDHSVIRNNPHFSTAQFNPNVSRMTGIVAFGGMDNNTFDRLPSYDDVVSGRFVQPSQLRPSYDGYPHRTHYGNTTNPDNYRHSFSSQQHQQQFYHQGLQRNSTCRKQNNFVNPNFVAYPHTNNSNMINETACYQPPNNQKLFEEINYSNDFQACLSDSRFPDFGGQSYHKMNFNNCEFFTPHQHSFTSQQPLHSMNSGVNDQHMTGYQSIDRNNYYWGCHSNNNNNMDIPYQKQENMNIINSSFPSQIFPQQPINFNNIKHPATYAASVSSDVGICMADNRAGISLETELSLIEDIINKK